MQTNQQPSPTEVLKLIENYEQMFLTAGWKELIQDITEKERTLFPSLMADSSDEKGLYFTKGMHRVYHYILGMEQMVTNIRAQLEFQTLEAQPDDAV